MYSNMHLYIYVIQNVRQGKTQYIAVAIGDICTTSNQSVVFTKSSDNTGLCLIAVKGTK